MFKSYFIIAYRSLLKNKAFTLINILGLVIGMTACLLLINYITFERSFDRFHDHSENIYRITHEFYQKGELKSRSAAAYSPLATVLQQEIPEVSAVARIHPVTGTITSQEKKSNQSFNEEHIYFTDSSFFDVFSLKTVYGSNDPLTQPNTAVITEKTAIKYFGDKTNPVGRSLHWHDGSYQATFLISAVVEDAPKNSHLDFDFLLSFSTLERLEATSMIPLEENWGWPGFYTYIQVKPATNVPVLESKINAIVDKHMGEKLKSWNNAALKFHLQPLTDIHLYSKFQDELSANGEASTIEFISIIAGIVLLIAYVNYVNLSTVRSLERAREVGIRKVMGSHQWQLVKQFILESFLINAFALLLSFLLYYLALPFAHYFTTSSLVDVLWISPYMLPLLVFLLFLGPLLSSLYPALVLSSYKPAAVLKGSFKSSLQGTVLRKGLVILQYIASVAMIAGTLIVFEQIQYMRSKDLGVNLDQLLILHGPKMIAGEENGESRMEAFKATLLQQSNIKSVSVSSAVPGTAVKNIMMYKSEGEAWENAHTIATMKVDAHFIDTYQAKILAGRNFSVDNQRDMQQETLLINEAAAFLLGFDDPKAALQQKVVSALGEEREVVGIIKNYHQHSVAQDYQPLLFVVDPSEKAYISIKISSSSLNGYNGFQKLLETIEAAYHHYYQDNAFDYFFLDSFFDQQYQAEIKFSRLFTFFSILAIVVAGLGLFGLASYTTMQRTKEIGIRKVLGASLGNILLLLSKDYIKLILIALAIAIPIANYFIIDWLENFSFRIELNWWLFAIPSMLILIIALLSVSGQTVKAARQNPVDSLRYE